MKRFLKLIVNLSRWDWIVLAAAGIVVGSAVMAAVTDNSYWLLVTGLAGLVFLS